MVVLRRLGSLVLWAISVFLIYAVIHAASSAGGARVGVAIGYVIGAILLTSIGVWLWRIRPKPRAGAPAA